MLNFNHKQTLTLAVFVISMMCSSAFAAPCATASDLNCCGNGVLESGEVCDMGFGNNKGDTDGFSGCLPTCQKAGDTTNYTWTCPAATATATADLKSLLTKLANWHAGKNATGGTIPTGTGVTTNPKADCTYYDSNTAALTPRKVITPWAAAAADGSLYNCAQYQKDMMKFISLNNNTPSLITATECSAAKTIAGTANVNAGRLEFANPLPLDPLGTGNNTAAKFNQTNHNYIVNGC